MIYYYDYTQAIDNKYSRDSWIEDTPPTSFEFEEESILLLPPPKDSLPGWKYVFKCSQKVSFYFYKVCVCCTKLFYKIHVSLNYYFQCCNYSVD